MAYLIVGLTDDCPTEEAVELHHVDRYDKRLYDHCQDRFEVWAVFQAAGRIGTKLDPHDKLLDSGGNAITPPTDLAEAILDAEDQEFAAGEAMRRFLEEDR